MRLRFAVAVVLLAFVPLALAYWAFARVAAGNEIDRADAHMNASLRAAVTEFAEVLEEAEARGVTIANSPPVQRALARRDAEDLVRLARANPNVTFAARGLVAGQAPPVAAQRTVNVVVDGRRAGRVAVAVPLDHALLVRLAREAGLAPDDVLAVTAGERIAAATGRVGGEVALAGNNSPADVRVAGERYRALAALLPDAPAGAKLVALRPRDAIARQAGDLNERIFWAALAMLAAVAIGAYAGAPVLERGRLALQQRALATRVLSSVGDGVVLVDRDSVVMFWNRAAEAITGLRGESVRGRKIEEAIPQWRKVAEHVAVSADQNARARAETIPLDVGGTERWLSFSGTAFPDGTVYTFRDVTDERRLEEAKSDFVATISHELRTPLAAIHGGALTLRRGDVELDAAGREQLLATIADQSDRLANIVEDVLLTSRLATGEVPVARGTFDAGDVVREVVDAARARLPAGLTIDVTEPHSLPTVAGDGERARQVLANLVDNALKYSPEGGVIRVSVEADERRVRFLVQDEGIGVPPGEQERIFEKFYRLDPQLTRGVGGSGLGLYIARELVRRMDGRMAVASEPGAGSTFAFELPAARPQGETAT